jgi:hypothetical protein
MRPAPPNRSCRARPTNRAAMSQPQFGAFTASELYCPKCSRAQPVRERLLLVLPSGELYEYLCVGCGSSLGERTVTGPTLAARRVAPAPQRPVRGQLSARGAPPNTRR